MKSRKDLINEYKQRKPRMGIFAIRNTANGKLYISRANDLDRIWNAEQFKLDAGGHSNRDLQADWNEFGSKHFSFEVIHELKYSDDPLTDMKNELLSLEALTLEDMQPFGEKGYNRKPLGTNAPAPTR